MSGVEPDRPGYHRAIVPVWGREYIRTFLQYSLPSQLAEGNIDALTRLAGPSYVIATRTEDFDQIRSSSAYVALSRKIETHLVEIPKQAFESKYDQMSWAYFCGMSIGSHHDNRACFLLLAPDWIYAKNCFTGALALQAAGCRAVMTLPIRAGKESVEPVLDRWRDGEVISLSARSLLEAGFANLHPITASMKTDAKQFANPWPSILIPAHGKDWMLAMAWHLHPLVVFPRSVRRFRGSIDDGFLRTAKLRDSEYGVITDSDRSAAIEISTLGMPPITEGAFDIGKVRQWAFVYADRQHWNFLSHPILLKARDVTHQEDSEIRRDFFQPLLRSLEVANSHHFLNWLRMLLHGGGGVRPLRRRAKLVALRMRERYA